jgi:uncharacterized protein (DUF3084 family)
MLQVDEAIAHTPLKDLVQVQLVLAKIPTKALYKLQVSVAQEVQLRARTDPTELQATRNGKDALEFVVEQVKLETQEEKQRTNKLEQKLKEVFTRIPDNA